MNRSCKLRLDRAGGWKNKTSMSTMFPDLWSQEKVLSTIEQAFLNKTSTNGRYWGGVSEGGFKVAGYVSPTDELIIESVFPNY